ncbi:hypothetical protein HZA57_04335 [Candidatus Poribacteria bacterium]|nr:hypothetical protein [Candidatus Poribacteria bacterium]
MSEKPDSIVYSDEDYWEAARKLSVEERLDQATINPHRPVMDDGPAARIFWTMKEYKTWLNTLPSWMGYGTEEQTKE